MASPRVLVVLFLMATVVVVPEEASAMSCEQVFSAVTPCVNYLRSGGTCPAGCCDGVRSLAAAARTTPDRQTACVCLMSAASSVRGVNLKLAAGLPSVCRVSIPYKISPSTDCAKVG